MQVVVVGAGVIGLTTAVVLSEQHPQWCITLAAPKLGQAPPHALWECPPYKMHPVETGVRWAQHSWRCLAPLVDGEMVCATPCLYVSDSPIPLDDADCSLACGNKNFRRGKEVLLEPEVAEIFGVNHPYVDAFIYDSVVLDTSRYLRYLLETALKNGVTWRREEVASFDTPGVVYVNCTGVAPPDAFPVRGQVVHVAYSALKMAVGVPDGSYMIPLHGLVECGGTADEGQSDRTPSAAVSRAIVASCRRIAPGLVGARVEDPWVGLRPSRKSGVRLELEWINQGASAVVHNYGHGGSGFITSWGAAHDALDLVRSAVASLSSRRSKL